MSIVCLPILPEGYEWGIHHGDLAIKHPNLWFYLWVNSKPNWQASGYVKEKLNVESHQEAVNVITTWAWLG